VTGRIARAIAALLLAAGLGSGALAQACQARASQPCFSGDPGANGCHHHHHHHEQEV
jgi:hypothetical protein